MTTPANFWAKRIFPERQLVVRNGESIHYLALSSWIQAGALFSAVILVGGVGALVGAYHNLHRAIHRKEAEISAVSSRVVADASLRDQVAAADAQYLAMSSQFDEMTKQLGAAIKDNETLRGSIEAAEARAVVLDKERLALEQRLRGAETSQASKSGNGSDFSHQFARNRSELQSAELAHAQLQKQLHALQADSESSHAHTAQLKLALAAREHHLKELAAERDRLRSRLTQPPVASQLATAAPKPGAASKASPSRSYGSDLERLIASTGIDLDKLLGSFGSLPSGEGGPYIALSTREAAQYEGQREVALEALAKSLPLEAPLKSYVVESPFGARMDPFRHEMGFHSGVDLAAPYLSPVYSTAPGVVSFTGWQDGYGRVVEITHAHGIVTLYAHLHRILVARGERVKAHQELGLLGSTGRSTGPHVHYEVRVNGVPVDPAKFLNAGRGVQLITAK